MAYVDADCAVGALKIAGGEAGREWRSKPPLDLGKDKEKGNEGRSIKCYKETGRDSREKIRAKLGMRENSEEREEGCNDGVWVPTQDRDN